MCTQKGRAKTLNRPPIHAGLVGRVERERESENICSPVLDITKLLDKSTKCENCICYNSKQNKTRGNTKEKKSLKALEY